MTARLIGLEIARRIMRAIPDGFPTKTRLARFALQMVGDRLSARLPDRFGNVLCLPDLRESIALHLFAFGVYEPDTITAILIRLSHAGVYLDVGANVGALAIAVSAQRPQARIVCVEADPENAKVLRRNVWENKKSNVTIVECLAGPIPDPAVPFYRAPIDQFGMGSIGPQFNTQPVMLAQRTLDDILDELSIVNVDIAKLDVEGSELGALHGLVRRLNGSRPPAVVFEFSDWAEARIPGQSPGDAQAYLLSNGYRLFGFDREGVPRIALLAPQTTGSRMILALPSPR